MKEKIFNYIKYIIPKNPLTCPHCRMWIGMSDYQVKQHLDKFRDVINKKPDIYKEKPKNDCNNGKCD